MSRICVSLVPRPHTSILGDGLVQIGFVCVRYNHLMVTMYTRITEHQSTCVQISIDKIVG